MSEIKDILVKILDEIVTNTGISSSNLITEDGLVIASNSSQNEVDEEVNMNFAAISASILSMAERGIEIINTNKMLEQIKIDAGLDQNFDPDFTILISRVISNVLLQIIFPKRINMGLIHFEINKTIKEIKNIVQKDMSRDLFTSLGSLT
jgi:predicted regulator of Ras-like GTPase activity (Roadblock/LC7/MglB family)